MAQTKTYDASSGKVALALTEALQEFALLSARVIRTRIDGRSDPGGLALKLNFPLALAKDTFCLATGN
jgi:hypothetical protein